MSDKKEYLQRKKFYEKLLTIYGKNPVLEALDNSEVIFHRIHLSDTKKHTDFKKNIIEIAKKREIELVHHTRQSLSRISRNINQDQGVAADLEIKNYHLFDDFIKSIPDGNFTLIALDGITNPQNLGMIIRSVTASPSYGVLLPSKGIAAISPLVIKASAGTLFKSTIIRCSTLEEALPKLMNLGVKACALTSDGNVSINKFKNVSPIVYVLGNETKGVSEAVRKLCLHQIRIPMNSGVESLNVSVTAALLAFHN